MLLSCRVLLGVNDRMTDIFPKKIFLLSSLGHYVGLMMCCWSATYGW